MTSISSFFRARAAFAAANILGLGEYRAFLRPKDNPIPVSKFVSVALFAGLLLVGGFHHRAQAAEAATDDAQILGYWQRGEGEAIIEIRRHEDGYHGVIIASEIRPETVGVVIFRDLRYDAKARIWHGRAYSIKRKREVRIDIQVPRDNRLELTAYVLVFKRLVQFRRVPAREVASLRVDRDL